MIDEKANSLVEYGDVYSLKLNREWTVWLHPKKAGWSIADYKNLGDFDSIGSMWDFLNNIDITHHDFYIFEKNIPPIYDISPNSEGGSISLRPASDNTAQELFNDLVMGSAGETLFEEKCDIIAGISSSITDRTIGIKLWLKIIPSLETLPKPHNDFTHICLTGDNAWYINHKEKILKENLRKHKHKMFNKRKPRY